MSDGLLFFNGINGSTGEYIQPPLTPEQLAKVARGEAIDEDHKAELEWRKEKDTGAHYGVIEGIEPKDLGQTGWGVLFSYDADAAIRNALEPLLDYRKEQAGDRYREYLAVDGLRPGENKTKFLARQGAGPGAVDPAKVPYYLMIVGDPEKIPYKFQYQLDVQYAVGRIHFDSVEEYARYAQSVVDAEKGFAALGKTAAFWGTANPDDKATELSANDLVAPLAEAAGKDKPDWKIRSLLPKESTKGNLGRLLGGADTPAFLFTASHGMGYPNGHSLQLANSGALVCQEWQGPYVKGKVSPDIYFSAEDLSSEARLHGQIAMFFACYGAGCPKLNEYAAKEGLSTRPEIAPNAFVSRLPQRMLAHPKGGALAVIGHVERAWGYSFSWPKAGRQLNVFESTLKRLMEGHPVGSALEYFNSRYAELSSDLSSELEEITYEGKPAGLEFAGMWTANNDARNYAVIGDPAVRLQVRETAAMPERPVITVAAKPDATAGSTPAPEPKEAARADAAEAAQYGVFDSLKEAQASAGAALRQVAEKIGESLRRTVEGLMNLEVATYVSDNLKEVKYEDGKFTGAQLRAVTRMGLDGRTLVCVPQSDGKVDDALWKVHMDAVEKASAHRIEMMKLAASVAANLTGGWK